MSTNSTRPATFSDSKPAVGGRASSAPRRLLQLSQRMPVVPLRAGSEPENGDESQSLRQVEDEP
jgi:hypothetical protein